MESAPTNQVCVGFYTHIIEILLLECDRDAMPLYMLLLGVFCIVQRAKVRFLQEK